MDTPGKHLMTRHRDIKGIFCKDNLLFTSFAIKSVLLAKNEKVPRL